MHKIFPHAVSFLIVFLLFNGCKNNSDLSSSSISKPEDNSDLNPSGNKLKGIRCFAFGPTGIGAMPSQGEVLFNEVCNLSERDKVFTDIFNHGTSEAKCYALVALREFSSESYKKYYAILKNNAPENTLTMSGCFTLFRPTVRVLESIDNGEYSRYVKK